MTSRFVALVCVVAFLGAAPASYPQRVYGDVIAANRISSEILLRHRGFDSMPAMTMSFRVVPRAALATVHPGDGVTGLVDERTEPWTISGLRIVKPATAVGARYIPLLGRGDTVPLIPLVNARGRTFSFASFRGQTVVVSFMYTRCRDPRMCPLVSAKFAQMQRRLRLDPASHVHLLEISLDPAYDTTSVLAHYASVFGTDARWWTLATGTPEAVGELASRFGVQTQFATIGLVLHSEAVAIVDRDGRVARTIDGNSWSPGEVLAESQEIAGGHMAIVARALLWLRSGVSSVCGAGRSGSGITASTALLLFLAILSGITFFFTRAFGNYPGRRAR